MAHQDRKTRKMRGSRMHGYGNTQKHRGAGSRGGHGMAGSKKHKWTHVSKYMPDYFGKKGFKKHGKITSDRTINAGQLSAGIKKYVADGKASHSNGTYAVDLDFLGYTKLLGTGKVEVKLKVKVKKCSANAKEKIEAAGGSVETPEKTTESGD